MKCFSHFLFFPLLFTSLGLHAAVVPLQDRVVFSSTDSDRRLLIVNNDRNAPALLQSWIDDGSSGELDKEKNYPFVVIPAVAKMSPGKILNMRILPTEKIRELLGIGSLYSGLTSMKYPALKNPSRRKMLTKWRSD